VFDHRYGRRGHEDDDVCADDRLAGVIDRLDAVRRGERLAMRAIGTPDRRVPDVMYTSERLEMAVRLNTRADDRGRRCRLARQEARRHGRHGAGARLSDEAAVEQRATRTGVGLEEQEGCGM